MGLGVADSCGLELLRLAREEKEALRRSRDVKAKYSIQAKFAEFLFHVLCE
jgi:hypothetical protein